MRPPVSNALQEYDEFWEQFEKQSQHRDKMRMDKARRLISKARRLSKAAFCFSATCKRLRIERMKKALRERADEDEETSEDGDDDVALVVPVAVAEGRASLAGLCVGARPGPPTPLDLRALYLTGAADAIA